MKFNWGTNIAIVYISFVVLMIAMVFFVSGQDHDLVAEDYYDQEIKYQDKIDRAQQTADKHAQVILALANDEIIFRFPKEYVSKGITGEVAFMRPSNLKLDQKLPIIMDESGIMHVSAVSFEKGFWRVSVNWRAGSDTFSTESSFSLP
jgi:hypothetical protein